MNCCPNCGNCPICGRSFAAPYPTFHPYYYPGYYPRVWAGSVGGAGVAVGGTASPVTTITAWLPTNTVQADAAAGGSGATGL